jgi:hypothetical protein
VLLKKNFENKLKQFKHIFCFQNICKMETKWKHDLRPKNMHEFFCSYCDYLCSKKSLWTQHTKTKKHRENIFKKTGNTIFQETKSNVCENCKKSYKSRGGLWKHQKKCLEIISLDNKSDNVNIIIKKEKDESTQSDVSKMSELLKTVVKDNAKLHQLLLEQQKQMGLMIPKIGNNNNNKFNLNFFLNEKCKNAINFEDFINSLNVQLEDLEFTKTNGISKGVTNVLMNGLKQLDIYNRPIHCTDTKRTTMYVKDKDEWERDQQHDKIKESISTINKKHIAAIKEWELAHPNWEKKDSMTEEYMQMVRSVTGQDEQSENTIIRNVAKEVLVDKD